MTTAYFLTMVAVVAMAARISQKAGYSGWWGFVHLIPVAGVVAIWVLAFIDWPAARPLRLQREDEDVPPRE